MTTFKHISSKNADYGAAEQYLTFEHDEFTMKPTLDKNGRLVLRDDVYTHASFDRAAEQMARIIDFKDTDMQGKQRKSS